MPALPGAWANDDSHGADLEEALKTLRKEIRSLKGDRSEDVEGILSRVDDLLEEKMSQRPQRVSFGPFGGCGDGNATQNSRATAVGVMQQSWQELRRLGELYDQPRSERRWLGGRQNVYSCGVGAESVAIAFFSLEGGGRPRLPAVPSALRGGALSWERGRRWDGSGGC